MPFGLDALFWHLAARGCDGILWVAQTVAGWPYANLAIPAMPTAAMIAVALGLIVLCLLKSRWRVLGLASVLVGLASPLFTGTPDILVAGDAKLVAIKDGEGHYRLNSLRAAKLAAETWLRRNGQIEAVRFPAWDEGEMPDFSCDELGCRYARNGRRVALAWSGEALREDCASVDLVISAVPIRRGCARPATIDRFDLWRGGAHAVWIEADGKIRIESVAATLGDRPWVLDRMRKGIRENRLVGDPDITEGASNDTAPESSDGED
jgi:competence protein ComEC